MKIGGIIPKSPVRVESIPKVALPKQSFKDVLNTVIKSIEPQNLPGEKISLIKNPEIRELLSVQGEVSKSYLNVELVTRSVESLNGLLRRFQNSQ